MSSSQIDSGIQKIIKCVVTGTKTMGISSANMPVVIREILSGATRALDDIGVPLQFNALLATLLNSSVEAIKETGMDNDTLLALMDELVEGVMTGLAAAGVTNNDLSGYTTTVSSTVITKLREVGVSKAKVEAAQEQIENATTDAVKEITTGTCASAVYEITNISGNTDENGTQATFKVRLTADSSAAVSIDLSSSDETEGTVSPTRSTFTSENWRAYQIVTVKGINDDADDGDRSFSIILSAATSSDSSYHGMNPGNVSVVNVDNDTAGFTVSSISGKTTEAGGTATFTVKLGSQPTADVTIAVTSSDPG